MRISDWSSDVCSSDLAHRALGAKMVPFGGWDMPLSYGDGTLAEHRACREAAVVFDVSHLGSVRVSGPAAHASLQRTLTNDLDKVRSEERRVGKACVSTCRSRW